MKSTKAILFYDISLLIQEIPHSKMHTRYYDNLNYKIH